MKKGRPYWRGKCPKCGGGTVRLYGIGFEFDLEECFSNSSGSLEPCGWEEQKDRSTSPPEEVYG